LAILIVGASLSYYFAIFLPKQTKENKERDFLFSMKQECQKAGDKLFQADVKSMGENTLFVPRYAYNKLLNTCLYSGGHIEKEWVNKWIKDSFTNKDIASYMSYQNKVIQDSTCPECLSLDAFDKKEKELFGE
jgi:hypothetical protein